MTQSTSKSKPSSYTLLSNNASPLERALEHSISLHLDEIAPPFPNLRDATTTPAVALPYLAADKMLTYWKSDDSIAVKRAQVSKAQIERKYSGTKYGLREALDAIGYGCEINSRDQNPELPAFTLDIVAWKNDSSPVNPELINQLLEKIDDIKSTRDTVELSLAFGVETEISLAGAKSPPTNVSYTDAPAVLWPMPEASASLGIAGGICPSITVNHLYADATIIPVVPTATAQVGAGSYSVSVAPISASATI